MDSAASSSSSLFRWPTASHTALALTTTVVATAAALVFARSALWPRWARVLPSPLKTVIPHTSKEDLAKLVYRPDQFPGARDVETPVRTRIEAPFLLPIRKVQKILLFI